jgi:hypothetical protein
MFSVVGFKRRSNNGNKLEVLNLIMLIKCLFESMVAVVFQSTFHAKMHQNDVFSFFKNYFKDQRIKTIQNIQKKIKFL